MGHFHRSRLFHSVHEQGQERPRHGQIPGLGGRVTEVPLIRGRLFPRDEERGILTAEEGRILGAMECLWVDQGCQYSRFGNGAVSCYCYVPVRSLARLLGWESFGGRDLAYLKRKAINLKMKAYYLELDTVEGLKRAGLKGYGFTLIDGFELIDRQNSPPIGTDHLSGIVFRSLQPAASCPPGGQPTE